jgi:hypothetical protein
VTHTFWLFFFFLFQGTRLGRAILGKVGFLLLLLFFFKTLLLFLPCCCLLLSDSHAAAVMTVNALRAAAKAHAEQKKRERK